jgi:hypothetical protein
VISNKPIATPTTVMKIETPYALSIVAGALNIILYASNVNSLGKILYPWNRI